MRAYQSVYLRIETSVGHTTPVRTIGDTVGDLDWVVLHVDTYCQEVLYSRDKFFPITQSTCALYLWYSIASCQSENCFFRLPATEKLNCMMHHYATSTHGSWRAEASCGLPSNITTTGALFYYSKLVSDCAIQWTKYSALHLSTRLGFRFYQCS